MRPTATVVAKSVVLKKRSGGRLKQDLDKDFLNNLGLHTCHTRQKNCRVLASLYMAQCGTVRQDKRNHFYFMNKSFNTQCNWTKFSIPVVNEYIIDVTDLISGIYANFCRLLCKKCDIGHYVINHGVMKLMMMYRLVFIVSISLLHKILNACQN